MWLKIVSGSSRIQQETVDNNSAGAHLIESSDQIGLFRNEVKFKVIVIEPEKALFR